MKPIYKPKGAAAEYGDYAVNIYTGCPHRCYYCFAPQVLHKKREVFHSCVEPRKDIVREVRRQLEREQITGKLIHLCFTCDPYPAGHDTTTTREVIQALKEYGNHVQILTKGCGAFDFDLLDGGDWYGVTIAKTDAEIWLKVRQAAFNPVHDESIIEHPRISPEDRRQEYFTRFHRKWDNYDYFEFHYSMENVRIEAREQRDILQDLRDVADGIEVVHEADKLRAAKEQKKARRAAGKEQRSRAMEKLILQCGWEGLDRSQRRRAEKLLDADRIDTLCQMRSEKELDAPEVEQTSLFE